MSLQKLNVRVTVPLDLWMATRREDDRGYLGILTFFSCYLEGMLDRLDC